MFLKTETQTTEYRRRSKTGVDHSYRREKTLALFRCDSCDTEFSREKGKMDPKRLSNNYFHVCSNCDAKRFAQKRGIQKKQVWDLPASSGLDISKL
jgi:DNA-directed RNA polymerase subunit RPC12/RpoP